MRSPVVVVGLVPPQHGAEVPLVDDDQLIQALSAECAYHAFGDGVRLGGPDRGEYGFDAQPSCPCIEAPTVAAVAVADEKLRLLTPRRGLNQLLPDPLRPGMEGHVQVYELAPAMGDEERYVESLQGQRLHCEEVGCPDMRRVVLEKGSPGLRWKGGAILIGGSAAPFESSCHSPACGARPRCGRCPSGDSHLPDVGLAHGPLSGSAVVRELQNACSSRSNAVARQCAASGRRSQAERTRPPTASATTAERGRTRRSGQKGSSLGRRDWRERTASCWRSAKFSRTRCCREFRAARRAEKRSDR